MPRHTGTNEEAAIASLGKRLLVPLRALRPRFAVEVETVVEPTYARRDEVAAAIADIRRLLADQLDGDNESGALLGRELAAVRASTDAMDAELARLSARLDRIETLLRDAAGTGAARPTPSSLP